MNEEDQPPIFGTWRRAYFFALAFFAIEVVAALRFHGPVFVNRLDYFVLIATILAIPLYGLWRTRGHPKVSRTISKATKAFAGERSVFPSSRPRPARSRFSPCRVRPTKAGSASSKIISANRSRSSSSARFSSRFIQRLKVYTAYEYLGQRFDQKTRYLGAFLFLIQRGSPPASRSTRRPSFFPRCSAGI